MKKVLLSLKKPSVFIPIVLGVALLAALLSFSDIHKVLKVMEGFARLDLLYYFLLMIAYETVRGVQWRYSLKLLKIKVPLSTQIFAFALSEVTKVLPIGNYFQNYVLQEEGVDFGRTSAATTLIILEEVVVSLVGVVALGLGKWTTWVRIVILAGMAAAIVTIWLLARFHHHTERPDWIKRRKVFNKVADEFGRFREGAVDLMNPRALAGTLACSVSYLVIGGAALYVVASGLNIGNVNFTEALSVYFFSLAIALILPLPIDFGVIEISGVGAFLAIGVSRDAALGAVFANRILSILASIAIAAVVVLVLHKEVSAFIHYIKREDKPGEAAQRENQGDDQRANQDVRQDDNQRNGQRNGQRDKPPGGQDDSEQDTAPRADQAPRPA